MDLNKLCFVTRELGNNTKKIRFMYREKPDNDSDSGWRFFSGDEDQVYVDNPDNILSARLLDVVEEIDPSVKKYLDSEIGSAFERENENDEFKKSENFQFGKDLE